MNIFYLDHDPKIAADYHCLKHTVKMILESFQMLSTTHRLLLPDVPPVVYKIAHKNHPSTKWVRQSSQHYKWLYELTKHLSFNYEDHYGKKHLSWVKLGALLETPPYTLNDNGFVPPPQCMPDYCKMEDTVDAYRNYYIMEKHSFAKWPENKTPYWYCING